MGMVESKSQIEIVPPPDCDNYASCPRFQSLVSQQLETLPKNSTPKHSSAIIGWSEQHFGQREMGVIYAERLPRTNSAVMSPPLPSIKIDNCASCSIK